MAGAVRTLVVIGQVGDLHLADLVETLRVQLGGGRQVYQVAAARFKLFDVAVERAWIVIEILVRSELHRVDKNAAQAAVAQRLPFFDQRHMPGVQVAHGWNKRDRLVVILPVLHVLTQFDNAGGLVHASVLRRRCGSCPETGRA